MNSDTATTFPKVVCIQPEIAWENKLENHQRIDRLLSQQDIAAGSLIILPEMFDTGFSMNLGCTAKDSADVSERFLRSLASRYESTVLGGVVGPVANGVASNEAVAIDAAGAELVRYQKMQPFTLMREDEAYGFGRQTFTFQWQGISVAPLICYDLRFPELFRFATAQGAELFVVIACWPEVRSEHWVRLLQARAIENLAISIGVNRTGDEPNLLFDGRTCGFDEQGRPLFEADSKAQVLQQPIDIDSARKWRRKFPALRDARYMPKQ